MQFSYDLESIVYEDEKYWILETKNHYEIYQTLSTYSRRCAVVGFITGSEQDNLNHAVEVLETMVKPDAHKII